MIPKLKLSEKSFRFRRLPLWIDRWLEERFGYMKPLFKDNECVVFGDTVVMKPEMARLINSII